MRLRLALGRRIGGDKASRLVRFDKVSNYRIAPTVSVKAINKRRVSWSFNHVSGNTCHVTNGCGVEITMQSIPPVLSALIE